MRLASVSATLLLLLVAACRDSSAPAPDRAVFLTDPVAVGIGDTVQLVARVPLADGTVDPRARLSWQSLTPSVASVDSTGLVVARDTGTAVVVVRHRRQADTVTFQVAVLPRRLDVTIAPESAFVGGAAPLVTAVVRDGLGRPMIDVLADVRSSDSRTLAVGRSAGRTFLTGMRDGEATITVEAASLRVVRTLRVALPGEPLPAGVVKLALGEISGCLLDQGGVVSCWGLGGYGNLGRGDDNPRGGLPLAPVSGDVRFLSLDVDATGACALATTRRVYCWGTSAVPSRAPRPTPLLESLPMRAVSVGMSGQACAVEVIGTLWCWGARDDATWDSVPRRVIAEGAGALTRVDVGAGGSLCAIDDAGRAYCRGPVNSVRGVSGDVLVRVEGVPALELVTVGDRFACGLAAGGEAWCWGSGTRGQLGGGTVTADPAPAQRVVGDRRYVEIAAGVRSVCGRTGDGEIWCWGNGAASYGNAWTDFSATPLPFSRVHRFAALEQGSYATAGLLADGSGFRYAGSAVFPLAP